MTNTIYKKLFEIQKAHLAVTKDSKNPFFKSKFISLDNIVSTLSPHLDKQKLLVFHKTEDGLVKTVIADAEGDETIESCFPMPDLKDPQKLGAVISYAKRYNLGQLFNIITDRDDDAEAAREEIAKPKLQTMVKEDYDRFKKKLEGGELDKGNIEQLIKDIKKVYDISGYEKNIREMWDKRLADTLTK